MQLTEMSMQSDTDSDDVPLPEYIPWSPFAGEGTRTGSNSATRASSPLEDAVFRDKLIVFSACAVMNDYNQDEAYRRCVEQVGGLYVSGLRNPVSKESLEGADIFITSHRDNGEYVQAQATVCKVIIGTPAWFLHVSDLGRWSAPEDHLLHYPPPGRVAPGFGGQMITITNYYGDSREYLKKLICALGGRYTPSLTSSNGCVIASHVTLPSDEIKHTKISKAREWGIPVVNHLWLEDCFREWKMLPTNDPKYLNFPQGYKWMDEIDSRGFERPAHRH